MSIALKPRKLNIKSINNWYKNGYILLNRRPILLFVFTLMSLLISSLFLSTYATIVMALIVPTVFSFWVPVIIDKSTPLHDVSYKEIFHVIKNTMFVGLSVSVIFFIVIIIPSYLVLQYLPDSGSNILPNEDDLSVIKTILFTFLVISVGKTVFEPKLTLSFYVSLYSGMSFNQSIKKVLHDSEINVDLFSIFHAHLLAYEIIVFISLAILSVLMPILSIALVVISQSYITCVMYMIYKDIYTGEGGVDEVKEISKEESLNHNAIET